MKKNDVVFNDVEDGFVVKASELSLDSLFMQHEPESKMQKEFKERLKCSLLEAQEKKENSCSMTIECKPNDTKELILLYGCILYQLVEIEKWDVNDAWYSLCDEPQNKKLWDYFIELQENKKSNKYLYKLLIMFFAKPMIRELNVNSPINSFWQSISSDDKPMNSHFTKSWLVIE